MNPKFAEKMQDSLLSALADAVEVFDLIHTSADHRENLRADLYMAAEIAANLAHAYATVCGEQYRAAYWFGRADYFRDFVVTGGGAL